MPADYTSSDPADRLAAVRASIAKILDSQEYETEDGRRNRRAELMQLYKMEKDLVAEIAAASSTLPLRLTKLRPAGTV